jgi:hypothetical protein
MKSPFQLRFSLCFVSPSRLKTVSLSLFLGVFVLSLSCRTYKSDRNPADLLWANMAGPIERVGVTTWMSRAFSRGSSRTR